MVYERLAAIVNLRQHLRGDFESAHERLQKTFSPCSGWPMMLTSVRSTTARLSYGRNSRPSSRDTMLLRGLRVVITRSPALYLPIISVLLMPSFSARDTHGRG
jgi:hypothetical protein